MSMRASVIVPVHNKSDTIESVLRSLANQSAPKASFEVLVVDDHSNIESRQALQSLTSELGFRWIARTDGTPSASAARNAGINASIGDRLLLLDADVVLPPNSLDTLLADDASKNDVVWIETMGASVAESIWEFLGPSPSIDPPLVLSADQVHLADFRLSCAYGSERTFNHLLAPWVFFWTTAIWLDRQFLVDAGGFDESFGKKGSEDIELGYRLWLLGAGFRLAKTVKALHLPHPRDRLQQERSDRVHERQLLAKHPALAVEMLAAFDPGNANAALRAFADLKPLWCTTPPHPKEPILLPNCRNGELYVGPWIETEVIEALKSNGVVHRRAPLIGFCLPDEDSRFTAAVLPDVRGFLPEAAICRMLQEAWRVATHVYLLRRAGPLTPTNGMVEAAWRAFDRPYWERSQTLSRSYYDWRADRCLRVSTTATGEYIDVLKVIPSPDFSRRISGG